MEKINKKISKDFPPVKLFLDDLFEIEKAFSESGKKIDIKTNEYKFASIEELSNAYANKMIRNLEIETFGPYINLDFSKIYTKLYSSAQDTASLGIIYKLESIVKKSRRRPLFLYSYYFILIFMVLTWVVPYIPYVNNILFVTYFIGIFLYFHVLYMRIFQNSTVILSHRGSYKDFFSRNKDQLIINILNILLTAILAAFITANSPSIQALLLK